MSGVARGVKSLRIQERQAVGIIVSCYVSDSVDDAVKCGSILWRRVIKNNHEYYKIF